MQDKGFKLRGAVSRVKPFRVMTVMHQAAELEQQGRKIVHMEVGEPDFSTAAPIIEAGKGLWIMALLNIRRHLALPRSGIAWWITMKVATVSAFPASAY